MQQVSSGVKANIPFQKAVMDYFSFISCEFGTHFINKEATLLVDDMRRIMQGKKILEEKLSQIFEQCKKVAAISAVAAMSQIYLRQQ